MHGAATSGSSESYLACLVGINEDALSESMLGKLRIAYLLALAKTLDEALLRLQEPGRAITGLRADTRITLDYVIAGKVVREVSFADYSLGLDELKLLGVQVPEQLTLW
jgi:hypothetical protein